MFKQSKNIDMTTGPLIPKLLQFSLPIAFSLLLQMLYNTADLAVVGHFGSEQSLGAIGATGAVSTLIIQLFVGISVGTNIIVAQCIGAKNDDGVSKAVHTSILSGLIMGVFVATIGFLITKPMLILMNCENELLRLATIYLQIIFLGAPFVLLFNFGSAIMRAKGNTTKPLIYLAISGAVNVVLNLIFVIFFHLDVAGVAIATVISQLVALIMVIRDLIIEKDATKLSLKNLKIDGFYLKRIVAIGIPSGIQSSMYSITNIIAQSSIISLGESVVSGQTVGSNINNYLSIISSTFSQAVMSFVAQNHGANNFEYIKKIFKTTMLLSCIISVIASGIFLLLRNQLVFIYTTDENVIKYAMLNILIVAPFYVVWTASEVSMGISKGLGSSLVPMIITGIGSCVLRILYFIFIFPMYKSYEMIQWVYPISWTFMMILQVTWAIHTYKKSCKKANQNLTSLQKAIH